MRRIGFLFSVLAMVILSTGDVDAGTRLAPYGLATAADDSMITGTVRADKILAGVNADSGVVATFSTAGTAIFDGLVKVTTLTASGAISTSSTISGTLSGADITAGTVADARIASTIARDSEVSAGYQPLDANLTALAAATDLPVVDGGTGASNTSTARTNLGLAIGSNVQAYDADLTALATAGNSAFLDNFYAGVATWAGSNLRSNVTTGSGLGLAGSDGAFKGGVYSDGTSIGWVGAAQAWEVQWTSGSLTTGTVPVAQISGLGPLATLSSSVVLINGTTKDATFYGTVIAPVMDPSTRLSLPAAASAPTCNSGDIYYNTTDYHSYNCSNGVWKLLSFDFDDDGLTDDIDANDSSDFTAGTAGAGQILTGFTAYVGAGMSETSGTMPANGAWSPTPAAAGVAIPTGYHAGGSVAADADFVSGNIRSGVNIWGVAGDSYVVKTSSGTAPASTICTGYVAWVDGAEITGTMPNRGTVNYTPSTSNQTVASGYHSGGGVVSGDADLTAANIKDGVNIFGVAGSHPSGSPVYGFVMSNGTWNGNLGGLSGADAKLVSDLSSNNWKWKTELGWTISSSTVRAFLCGDDGDNDCRKPKASSLYIYLKSGDTGAGGSIFTTGTGTDIYSPELPQAKGYWDHDEFFKISTQWWFGGQYQGSGNAKYTSMTGGNSTYHCAENGNIWTESDYNEGLGWPGGGIGTTASDGGLRFQYGHGNCNSSYHLIAFVEP